MKKLSVMLCAGLLVLGVAVASASIPDSSGVIHGCYLTSGPPQARGSVRVIDTDAGQTCASGEVPLNWNQTGPQGPQGVPGVSQREVVELDVLASPVSEQNIQVVCPTGKTVLGGGFHVSDTANTKIVHSYPGGNSWVVGFSATATVTVSAYAICAVVT